MIDMLQSATNTYLFHLGRAAYVRTGLLGSLLCCGFLACAFIALVSSLKLLGAYSHTFTPYLKWQDALVVLLWYVTFLTLSGCVLIIRFLCALQVGYSRGMLTLVGDQSLTVRDLSAENLAAILWIMHAAFWCFVAVLVGLLPEMLIGWTLHIPHLTLAVLTTAIAVMLSIAGAVVSVAAAAFIIIGCVGVVSFSCKQGSPQLYPLDTHTALRIDNFVLTIIYPAKPESMIDLNTLSRDDQCKFLALLYERWTEAQQEWNPALGEEIETALTGAKRSAVLV